MRSEMRSRYLLTAALALVVLVVVANATAYAYRWINGRVEVAPPERAQGAACTGFYSEYADRGDNPLPDLGTNYDAPTYGGKSISVTPRTVVCEYTYGDHHFYLYESIEVRVPITVGTWWIKDFYAFGYYGNGYEGYVYVYIKVKSIISGDFDRAELKVYHYTRDGIYEVGTIDLKYSGPYLLVTMAPGEALRLDLWLDPAEGASGEAEFVVGFHVSQKPEKP